jgi:predicted signal transduction protein with EAL and GGDEF domain
MSDLSNTFVGALPDLSLLVRRDGLVISHLGGRDLGVPVQPGALIGKTLAELWPGTAVTELNRTLRTALKARKPIVTALVLGDRRVEARVNPQGVDRCSVIIRQTSRIELTGDSVMLDVRAPDPHDCAGFARKLCAAIEAARMRETRVGLLIVNLEALAGIEQAHGAAIRSIAVTAAAERLSFDCASRSFEGAGSLRASRIAGDQLAVLMDRVTDADAARRLASQVYRLLSKPVDVDGSTCKLLPSVGFAVYPEDALEADGLLERARGSLSDADPSRSKETGKACRAQRAAAGARQDLGNELRWAIEQGQFNMAYTSLVELQGRRVAEFVAVPKWLHAVGGEMNLQAYDNLLDSLDLCSRLDRWMLARACMDISKAAAKGNVRLRVHLPASRSWLSDSAVVAEIQAVAKSAEVELSRLAFVVDLQTVAASSPSLENIRQLRRLGIKLILGNFGNVDLAPARMGSLPLDGVRISRSLTDHCDRNALARAACEAAGGAARAFGLSCIAEGADRREQLEIILGTCTHASGLALNCGTDPGFLG